MKKLDEWLIGAKCALRRLFFGKQPGIDGIIVVIVLVIIGHRFECPPDSGAGGHPRTL